MCEKCDNTTNENKIYLKSTRELLGEKFFVPSYQRGYRWTEQEVRDLLDDINEFTPEKIEGKGKDEETFYCLQPLVVKRKEEEQSYEVIDGQQRLTTIFIILKYLGERLEESHRRLRWTLLKYLEGGPKTDTEKFLEGTDEYLKNVPYGLAYETRKISKDFLENLGDEAVIVVVRKPHVKVNLKPNPMSENNIDFFSMDQAYETIDCWFNAHTTELAQPPDKELFLRKLLNNVKFIWYETDESDPIKVFTRLNIGKIPLTNAELIKALFLNSSNFPGGDHLELRQREIANEWDQIEYTLQNEEFWLFIHNKGYNNPTRIDFIFDIICERESDSVNTTGIDSYRTFRHFYKSFKNAKKARKCIEDAKNNTEDAKKYIEKAKKLIEDVKGKGKIDWKKTYDVDEVKKEIEKCDTIYRWKEVKKIFQTFSEWFNDLELYHYVGYLVDRGEEIKGLYENWTESKNKNDFVENKLKEKIKKKIEKINNLRQQYKFDSNNEQGWLNKTECRPLLLLHNIQTVINQCKNSTEAYGMQVFHKFPFHIYKNESWDVEHIDSNTPNDLNKSKDQKWWLIAICDTINRNTKIEKAKKENLIEEIKSLRDTEIEKAKKENLIEEIERFRNAEIEKKEDLIEEIKKFYKDPDKDKFESLKTEIEKEFLKGEETFSAPEEKNKIWNFALLDASTNRGYGNSIFSAKRRCIIGKDKGKEIVLPDEWGGELKEEDAESSFIPPCTKYVFLKYYSPASSDPNYWTVEDAEKYRYNIFETLEEFGVKNADKSTENTNKGDEDVRKQGQ